MATLETVMQMKQQGTPEPQIIQTLQQQGISPKEINEALSQSKIKSELGMQQPTQESTFPGTAMPENMATQPTSIPQPGIAEIPQQIPPTPQTLTPENPTTIQSMQGMQPSMMMAPSAMPTQEIQQSTMPPATQETYPIPAPTAEMPYYEEYQPQQSADLETINDVAEQIVEEKTTNLKKQITDFTRFKDDLSLEVGKINERLTRIENTFNQLQMAILGKIGEYGKDIQNISKEMHETQNSFSKIINPLTDNVKALQKMTGTSPKPNTKKSSNEFENYLR